MNCEKCGAEHAEKYSFFVSLKADDNPFQKEDKILGRWHGFVCFACANRHWKRKVMALIIFLSILIPGLLINIILFPDLDLGILHFVALFALALGGYSLFQLLKQGKKVRGERTVACIKSGSFIKIGLNIGIKSEYDELIKASKSLDPTEIPISFQKLPESFDQLPELNPSDKIKALLFAFPEAEPAKLLKCDLCGQQKSRGMHLPLVVCWVHSRSDMFIVKDQYYAIEPLSVCLCFSCMEKDTIYSTLKALKRMAKDIGFHKIAQKKEKDTKLLDTQSLVVLTLEQYQYLLKLGKPVYYKVD